MHPSIYEWGRYMLEVYSFIIDSRQAVIYIRTPFTSSHLHRKDPNWSFLQQEIGPKADQWIYNKCQIMCKESFAWPQVITSTLYCIAKREGVRNCTYTIIQHASTWRRQLGMDAWFTFAGGTVNVSEGLGQDSKAAIVRWHESSDRTRETGRVGLASINKSIRVCSVSKVCEWIFLLTSWVVSTPPN